MTGLSRFLPAILMLTMVCSAAAQSPKTRKFLTKPLVIEDQGSFFIGGVPKITDYATNFPPAPNQITIGQMYVQFQVPQKKKRNMPPVIMVHGSSHTGACLESTPDGREGWYPHFVRKGFSTYVVDQAGRGRSGFDESAIHEGEAMIKNGDVEGGLAKIQQYHRIPDNDAWTKWFGRLVPPGSTILTGQLIQHGDPAHPPADEALRANDHAAAFPVGAVDANIVKRGGAIGPAPAGPNAALALEYYKQLVPNTEVTLPGSTCASCEPKQVNAGSTWTPLALALLVERLGGAIVITHSQAGGRGHHMTRILRERGHLSMLKGLITLEGSCSFTGSGLKAEDFDNVPYLAVKGDYASASADAKTCEASITEIRSRRAGGNGTASAEYIKLGELGNPALKGTTHMMMLGTNNLEVADVILKWVELNIPPRSGKRKR